MKQEVAKQLREAVDRAGFVVPKDFSINEPPKNQPGDWATNIALILASENKENPHAIARKIIDHIKSDLIEKAEIAGPGFINLTLANKVYLQEIDKILRLKEDYGKGLSNCETINVEYISANPTGPLHIGNARSGPIGEAFANLYEFLGHKVTREFLVNDRGTQIHRFGKSLFYWYQVKKEPGLIFPEDGYPAEYVKEASEKIQQEKAAEIAKIDDDAELIKFFAHAGLKLMVKNIAEDAALLNIKFDVWSYESEIVKGGKPKEIVSQLTKSGHTVEKEGAVWFCDPADPELQDKESVLIRSDEGRTLTYFATDLAYHVDKIERGAAKLVDIWGANHSGHIPRMKAAMRALGYKKETLEIVVYQYVRLKKSGKAVSMGKRLGNFVTLRQLIEAGIAPDAFKYFILSQNPNTPFDFDIDLAADTSEKNPVFYIKYAHARIASIMKKANEQGIEVNVAEADLNLLGDPKEVALYKQLADFPALIQSIAHNFQIQALPHYAYNLARLFHDFYSSCPVLCDDKKLTQARLALIIATKYIIANSLKISGIEAPEKM